MRIYPAIDLKDQACVRLRQGDYDQVTVYEQDPVKVAKRWEAMGAEVLHLVDLDGARDGQRLNEPVVREILKTIKIPVQLGGGIRDTETIRTYLELGVAQVILGTAAVANLQWTKDMLKTYGDRIVVSIDALNGWVATDGWESVSKVKALDYIKELESFGLSRLVYTDIEKDGMLNGPNFKMYQTVSEEASLEVIASGGITTLQDLAKLKALDLYGAIIGKALYAGKLNLEEVLQCSRDV